MRSPFIVHTHCCQPAHVLSFTSPYTRFNRCTHPLFIPLSLSFNRELVLQPSRLPSTTSSKPLNYSWPTSFSYLHHFPFQSASRAFVRSFFFGLQQGELVLSSPSSLVLLFPQKSRDASSTISPFACNFTRWCECFACRWK